MTHILIAAGQLLPAMRAEDVERVRQLESDLLSAPQPSLTTRHVLHGGMYSRTIHLPAGAVITGALVKVATTLIINGRVSVFIGSEVIELAGYNVIPASAGRKQAFLAHAEADLTMIFPTKSRTIQEAEDEFTDEAHLLLSRQQPEHDVFVIGEQACQE